MAAERRYSHVGVVREAEATDHLIDCLTQIEDFALDILPDRKSTGRRKANDLDEIMQEGIVPSVKSLRISPARTYGERNLRATLLERRLVSNQDNNDNLLALLGRLAGTDLRNLTDEESPDMLYATASRLVESTSRPHFTDPTKREFSAVIDDGPVLWRLKDEADALEAIAPGVRRGHIYDRDDESGELISVDIAGTIPILTVSKWAGAVAVEAFRSRVNLEGSSGPMMTFNLRLPGLPNMIRE